MQWSLLPVSIPPNIPDKILKTLRFTKFFGPVLLFFWVCFFVGRSHKGVRPKPTLTLNLDVTEAKPAAVRAFARLRRAMGLI